MRTRRVWTRRIVAGACCLALGALVTFIVAAQRAIWAGGSYNNLGMATFANGEIKPFAGGWKMRTFDISEYAWMSRELSGTGTLVAELRQRHGYTHAVFFRLPEDRVGQGRSLVTMRSGWPCFALEDTGVDAGGLFVRLPLKCGWQAPPWLAGSQFPRYVPLRPIPLGFAADSLLYSSVPWAALLALSWWRQRSRILKGHCELCNYDRAGLPPASPCPECGAAAPATVPHTGSPS